MQALSGAVLRPQPLPLCQPLRAARRHTARGRQHSPPLSCSSAGEVVREVLSRSERAKLDPNDDRQWYSQPRFTTHVDDRFLGQLTELYRQRIPPGARVLDLGCSHVSHLPPERQYDVVGMGLNAQELAANPRLSAFSVRNLNSDPSGWAHESASFDAVTCCVSVQYYQQPEKVMAEVFRVLRPGGVCIISFSNRQFYNKAIAAWRDGTGYSRSQLVKSYFSAVSGFTAPELVTEVQKTVDDSLLRRLTLLFDRSQGDPFYAVIANRNFRPSV